MLQFMGSQRAGHDLATKHQPGSEESISNHEFKLQVERYWDWNTKLMYLFPRLPQQMTMTGQLQPTKIYSAAVLEASSLRSTCQQDHIPQKSVGRSPSLPPLGSWYSLACGSATATSICHHMTSPLCLCAWVFPGGSVVKNLPAKAGDVGSILGWNNPLETETESHSSILAWKILWTEVSGRLQSRGPQRVGHDWKTKQHSPLAVVTTPVTGLGPT